MALSGDYLRSLQTSSSVLEMRGFLIHVDSEEAQSFPDCSHTVFFNVKSKGTTQ